MTFSFRRSANSGYGLSSTLRPMAWRPRSNASRSSSVVMRVPPGVIWPARRSHNVHPTHISRRARMAFMATFVLVHGGGHGGWCWQPVARLLGSRGHEVYAPTLTGFGDRSHLADGDIDFATFVTDVEALMWFEDLHDVVLVGHSMGGVVIPRVAEKVPERLRRVVWLAAAVTADGETLL